MPPRHIRTQVPASTSNVGCGFDALGIALSIKLRVDWWDEDANELTREGELARSELPTRRDPVLRGLRRVARRVGTKPPTGRVKVAAPFPPGCGMGASGAGLVAGLLLGRKLLGAPLSDAELLAEAIDLDGHPENVTASLLGGAHWSVPSGEGLWLRRSVPVHRELRFLLLVPPFPLDTGKARAALPTSVAFQRAVDQQRRSPILLDALHTLDPQQLSIGLDDRLHAAARLRLIPGGQPLLEATSALNPLGVTLSGAGSSLLVLVRRREAAQLRPRVERLVRRHWGAQAQVLEAGPAQSGAGIA